MSSDHAPTCCTNESVNQTVTQRFNYSKANWQQLQYIVDLNTHSLPIPNTTNEIDNAIETLSSIILNA